MMTREEIEEIRKRDGGRVPTVGHPDHAGFGADMEWAEHAGRDRAALLDEVDGLRLEFARAAACLASQSPPAVGDTIWFCNGVTLWEFLNLNGDRLEQPTVNGWRPK